MAIAKNITDLTGRVAVVIGGTSGLGRSIALSLAASGADVVATGRRKELVDKLADEVLATGRRTMRHAVDVADRSSIESLRDAVVKELGRVDILVNAAGRTLKKPAADFGETDWANIIDTNLTGVLRTCQTFYPELKKS